MDTGKWEYDTSLGDHRLQALSDPPIFGAIIETIRSNMRIVCCHPEPCDIASGFERIVYCVQMDRDLFDLFFNSRAGYRAAYFRSPYDGLRANAEALAMLSQYLVSSEATRGQRPRRFIEESLSSPTAKVWLAEPECGFCPACSGEWSNPKDLIAEIRNGRWEQSSHDNSVKGRKAPYYSKLRVFGAFVNGSFDEVVAERKRHRATHLNQWGWA